MATNRPTTLTKAVKRRIADDWLACFPGLGEYESMHLLRFVPPLLIGICLDRDSSGRVYRPTFHVHSLTVEFPVVSLGMTTYLRTRRTNAPESINVRWHEEKYVEAAERMREQALLPLEGDLRARDVLDAYQAYLRGPDGRSTGARFRLEMICLCTWAGSPRKAHAILKKSLRDLTSDRAYMHVGGREGYQERALELIDHPELVKQTVDAEAEKLKVNDLPRGRLLT